MISLETPRTVQDGEVCLAILFISTTSSEIKRYDDKVTKRCSGQNMLAGIYFRV